MMRRIVISQPMFFPWAGFFNQVLLSDMYYNLCSVQMPGGQSFLTRVQLLGPNGIFWWSIPTRKGGFPQSIQDVALAINASWVRKSLTTLQQIFAGLPFAHDAVGIAENILTKGYTWLHELNQESIVTISRYLSIPIQFLDSHEAEKEPDPSLRLTHLIKAFGGNTYITGHGARNYLNHQLLEEEGIDVQYIIYDITPYSQQGKAFTPYVSILDLIARQGKNAVDFMQSRLVNWKEFTHV